MKFIFLIFCLCYSFYPGQNKRFVYLYDYVKDSAQSSERSQEIYNLDISKFGSVFYNYDAFKMDSIARSCGETAFLSKNKVYKKYPDFNIVLISKVGRDIFKVSDEREIHWKISSDIMQIGLWKSQKATASFAGREWIAWFSTEIPLQDGPYKFHGLPGLIIKIEDKRHSHIFELSSIRNLTDSELRLSGIVPTAIPISQKDYVKAFKEYRLDPMKGWRQMGIVKSKDDLSPDFEFLKNMSNMRKRQIAADNNILELEMLN